MVHICVMSELYPPLLYILWPGSIADWILVTQQKTVITVNTLLLGFPSKVGADLVSLRNYRLSKKIFRRSMSRFIFMRRVKFILVEFLIHTTFILLIGLSGYDSPYSIIR